jgi:predicted transcriptional regulator
MRAMKKEPRKVHRNFKIPQYLHDRLVKEAEKTRRTQTAIVELALEAWFRTKQQAA